MRASLFPLALAVGLAAPASAQSDVTRQSYTFLGQDLIVEVHDRVAGSLKLLRGSPGRVEVVARASGGFATATQGGTSRDRIRLGSVGAYRVEYLVVAPENIRVQVRLPSQDLEPTPGTESATFTWDALPEEAGQGGGIGGGQGGNTDRVGSRPADNGNVPAAAPAAGAMFRTVSSPGTATRPEIPAGMFLTYVDRQTPSVIAFLNLHGVRSIEVRIGGDDFRVASSVPLEMDQRSRDQIMVNLGDAPPIDFLFVVPREADLFGIRVGPDVALASYAGEIQTRCEPTIVLTGIDGVQRARITPVNGAIDCRY